MTKPIPDDSKRKDNPPAPDEVILEPAGPVVVTTQETPPKPDEPKTIHERRLLPLVPKAPPKKPED